MHRYRCRYHLPRNFRAKHAAAAIRSEPSPSASNVGRHASLSSRLTHTHTYTCAIMQCAQRTTHSLHFRCDCRVAVGHRCHRSLLLQSPCDVFLSVCVCVAAPKCRIFGPIRLQCALQCVTHTLAHITHKTTAKPVERPFRPNKLNTYLSVDGECFATSLRRMWLPISCAELRLW